MPTCGGSPLCRAQAHTNAGIAYYKRGMANEAIAHRRVSLQLEPLNQAVSSLLAKAAPQHP
jgi:hypothetical protein